MGNLKNNTSPYRHPVEESNSEIVWNTRNDLANITRPYDQIPHDDTVDGKFEDAIIDAIDHPKEFEEPYEETYDVEKIDTLIKEQDFWGLEKYLLRFPEGSEYVQFHYQNLVDKEENVDPIQEIEKQYPEYFPKKATNQKVVIEDELLDMFQEDNISGRKDYVEKKGAGEFLGDKKGKIFFKKGTHKKDRRHGRTPSGIKERRTEQNRTRRRKIKKDLKDLLAA